MKDYRNAGKRKENEFTWMVEQSRSIDKHLRKIHNGLRNNSLEQLISQSDSNMDRRYQRRYSVGCSDPRLEPIWTQHQLITLTNIDKNLHNGKVRHNLLMRMYDEQYNNLPWFKKLFTKRIKSGYYEI